MPPRNRRKANAEPPRLDPNELPKLFDRAAPFDGPAEMSFLGAAILSGALVMPGARHMLKPEDFWKRPHQLVWASLLRVFKPLAGGEGGVDLVTLGADLAKHDTAGESGGMPYLAELVNGVPHALHWEYYAKSILEASRARRAIAVTCEGMASLYAATTAAGQVEAMQSLRIGLDRLAMDDGGPRGLSPLSLCEKHPALASPLIEGMLRINEVGNLVAGVKVGKSWIVLNLAWCLATGQDFLGMRTATKAGHARRVLILDYELNEDLMAERVRMTAGSFGVPLTEFADRVRIVCCGEHEGENVENAVRHIEAAIADGFKPDVVFWDCLYQMLPDDMDENEPGDMKRLYRKLKAYSRKYHCAQFVVHHTTKGSQDGKKVTEQGSGSGVISRAPETHVTVLPHEKPGFFVVQRVTRSFGPQEPIVIRQRFPLWDLAPDEDPTRIATAETAKAAKAKAKTGQPEPIFEPAQAWPVNARGLEAILAGMDGRQASRTVLVLELKKAGMTDEQTSGLLAAMKLDPPAWLEIEPASGSRRETWRWKLQP